MLGEELYLDVVGLRDSVLLVVCYSSLVMSIGYDSGLSCGIFERCIPIAMAGVMLCHYTWPWNQVMSMPSCSTNMTPLITDFAMT